MPVAVRAKGKGEEYAVLVPAYACKDDLQQVVEDRMQIRNLNFFKLTKLVSLQLPCTVLELFLSYYLILLCYLAGYYCYPEHDLPALGIPVLAEGCREATALGSIDRFLPQGNECFLS